MYQTGHTIKSTLDQMLHHDLVLPAIQREFVWQPRQICNFFDSLMQGYPIGGFLYWQVQPHNSGKFRFYDFILNYHQRDNPHCPVLPVVEDKKLTAVLDGQQRLTALNIGLRGTLALKLPRLWWSSPDAFPKRKLYLDVLWQPDQENEEGLGYRFEFLTDSQVTGASEEECWFPVGDILRMKNGGPALGKWLNERLSQERVDGAHEILFGLYEVVHSKHVVAYYEEHEQELDKVVQIFIRMNSGGTVLSYSDMLLSVAVAQWTSLDAREEVHKLVDELNGIGSGFSFSKDLVLKAGLMLSDISSVGFKVDNFNRENMVIFESNWNKIQRALKLTVQLISNFGFNGQNLRATNAILPIAYYLYRKAPGDAYLASGRYQKDREDIREWLIRSLLKSGVWGSGLDTLLTALRQVVKESNSKEFPVAKIREEMSRRGRPLTFEDEEIENLVDLRFKDRLTFALLSLLFPHVDLSNKFHVDHIFPASRFTRRKLDSASVPEEAIGDFIQRCNGLANLQLLLGLQNMEKSAKMPRKWLREKYPKPNVRKAYRKEHLLGSVPAKIVDFDVFYDARRERLKARIEKLLGR